VNASSPRRHFVDAFTVIELLIVMSVIIVLAGLVLGTSGYVQKKGQRSRAEAEIAALSAALESYKADNGIYPREASSDALDPRLSGDPNAYQAASLFLFKELSGLDENGAPVAGAKSYFAFKPQMLSGLRSTGGNVSTITGIRDPFGNHYGYSTANQVDSAKGYNPTFDLWSTGGTEGRASPPSQSQWIKNW